MSDLYATLPKRLKIGPFTYRVEAVASGHELLGENNYGMTVFDKTIIFLDNKMGSDQLLNTLIHEVSHAVHQAYGIADGSDEETIATQSANGWMQVYLDNPKLLQWITRAVKEVRKTR